MLFCLLLYKVVCINLRKVIKKTYKINNKPCSKSIEGERQSQSIQCKSCYSEPDTNWLHFVAPYTEPPVTSVYLIEHCFFLYIHEKQKFLYITIAVWIQFIITMFRNCSTLIKIINPGQQKESKHKVLQDNLSFQRIDTLLTLFFRPLL